MSKVDHIDKKLSEKRKKLSVEEQAKALARRAALDLEEKKSIPEPDDLASGKLGKDGRMGSDV